MVVWELEVAGSVWIDIIMGMYAYMGRYIRFGVNEIQLQLKGCKMWYACTWMGVCQVWPHTRTCTYTHTACTYIQKRERGRGREKINVVEADAFPGSLYSSPLHRCWGEWQEHCG